MTEKRFTLNYINEQHLPANIYDNGTFIASIGIGEELIVELLNSLNDENEHLKQKLLSKEDIIQQMKIKLNEDYYKKWKKTNLNYIRVCEELAEENRAYEKLSEENEQLKIQRKNTTKEFQKLLDFIRSKGLTLTDYEEFKNSGDV